MSHQHAYTHRFKSGTVASVTLSDSAPAFEVTWTGSLTRSDLSEYLAWRREIVDDFSSRTGKKVLLVDIAT